MRIPEQLKEVGLKLLGAFGCAVVMIVPVAALFTACCVVVFQTAKDVAEKAGPVFAKGLELELKRVAIERVRTQARPFQSLLLVRSIVAGAVVPAPCAVFAVGSIDFVERSLQLSDANEKARDRDFDEALCSCFSVLALFGGKPAALPPPREKK